MYNVLAKIEPFFENRKVTDSSTWAHTKKLGLFGGLWDTDYAPGGNWRADRLKPWRHKRHGRAFFYDMHAVARHGERAREWPSGMEMG